MFRSLLLALLFLPTLAQAQIYDTLQTIVHVIHTGTAVGSGWNLDTTQVYSQYDVLNEDYRMQNPNLSQTPSVFMPFTADMGLNFAKAIYDPNGNLLAEPGIDRINVSTITNVSPAGYSISTIQSLIQPATVWDPTHYFNIWVIKLNTSFAPTGFVSLPAFTTLSCLSTNIQPDSLRDGVVIDYRVFGRNGTALPPFDQGRGCTHYIGHWLGLLEVDNNCQDDCVADTPLSDNTGGIPTFPHITCSNGPNGDMFMNFMSFADDSVQCMFTQGQKARIDTALSYGYFQSALRTNGPPLSIAQPLTQNNIQIFPNPSSDESVMHFPQVITGTVFVYTPDGRLVMQEKMNATQNLRIETSTWPNGIYLVQCRSEVYTGTVRLVVQH